MACAELNSAQVCPTHQRPLLVRCCECALACRFVLLANRDPQVAEQMHLGLVSAVRDGG